MIVLDQDQTLMLTDGRGVRIECHRGVLWVTSKGDHRDLFVAPGEILELRARRTLVTALEPSRIEVVYHRPFAWAAPLLSWTQAAWHAVRCRLRPRPMQSCASSVAPGRAKAQLN
jgi:DUF2917 family protein